MSRVIWSFSIAPESGTKPSVLTDTTFEDVIENVIPIPVASQQIACPDPKAFRSMSRASLLLSHVCMGANEALEPFLKRSPFSVGIYCAVENGPIDSSSTAKIVEAGDRSRFAELYRKLRNPKMYLKQLPNLVPAQMGISMGIQGPMNVYTHSIQAGAHALEQAEWDLRTGVVEAAMVCGSQAFDDFLVVKRTSRQDSRPLAEGAGALLLVNDGHITDWSNTARKPSDRWFGVADQIINSLPSIF